MKQDFILSEESITKGELINQALQAVTPEALHPHITNDWCIHKSDISKHLTITQTLQSPKGAIAVSAFLACHEDKESVYHLLGFSFNQDQLAPKERYTELISEDGGLINLSPLQAHCIFHKHASTLYIDAQREDISPKPEEPVAKSVEVKTPDSSEDSNATPVISSAMQANDFIRQHLSVLEEIVIERMKRANFNYIKVKLYNNFVTKFHFEDDTLMVFMNGYKKPYKFQELKQHAKVEVFLGIMCYLDLIETKK